MTVTGIKFSANFMTFRYYLSKASFLLSVKLFQFFVNNSWQSSTLQKYSPTFFTAVIIVL